MRDIITEAPRPRRQAPTRNASATCTPASWTPTPIATLGVRPLLDELAGVDAALTPTELAAELGALQRTGIGGGTGLYVDTDSKNSTRYLLHLRQSGLGLPDESYYRDPQHAAILAEYPKHIARMFALVYGEHEGDWDATAAHIVALETKIAAAHWDVVKRRDADLTYNLRTFAELSSDAAGFDWPVWLHAMGGPPASGPRGRRPPTGRVVRVRRVVGQRGHRGLAALAALAGDPRAGVAAVGRHRRRELRVLRAHPVGHRTVRDRWKRGVGLVESLMGDAVGRLYVERHFPPDAKARMDELVANLREAYRVSISDLQWMTPETRQRALDKLDKFTPKIGYPAKWRDYSTLVIARDDVYGNYQRGYALEFDRDLAKLGGPVDRDEWFMTPQTVNAYYNPGMNEIVFPAAILQPPFFDAEADDAANYGGIGAVIGHEIGHGFDDQGAKYDGDGNLVDWWTDHDRAEFGTRTKALIEQYEVFTPRGLDASHHVNGAFTVGENIGDLGGLSIALLAYQLSLNGEEAPIIDGLTGVQRVFFGWAQVWRTKSRAAEAIRRLPSTRIRRRSSAATASSVTSMSSTTPSRSPKTTSSTWIPNGESGSGTNRER